MNNLQKEIKKVNCRVTSARQTTMQSVEKHQGVSVVESFG